MLPEPLAGVFADAGFYEFCDVGDGGANVGVLVSGVVGVDGRVVSDAEAGWRGAHG